MNILNNIIDLSKHILFAAGVINHQATNNICQAIPSRPAAFSCWSHLPKPEAANQAGPVNDYTSWPMLTDRSYFARHLPPASQAFIDSLPPDAAYNPGLSQAGQITRLFARQGSMRPSRSSLFFMFFAQWFTDSVLRANPHDRRKTTSNHNIDLCQIYGLNEATARLLRTLEGGKLRSQIINGEVW